MYRKVVAVWASLALVLGFIVVIDTTLDFIPSVKGATLFVNKTGNGGAYMSIQDAIDAANTGDTVFVYNGTYIENVNVGIAINITGEDRNNTIIDGGNNGNGFSVNANWVNISGFSITNCGGVPFGGGISLDNVHNCTITDNNLSNNNRNGMTLESSRNNLISNNNMSSNVDDGILIRSSSTDNTIINNEVSLNGDNGIDIFSSDSNNITGNYATFNDRYGILIQYSVNCTIVENSLMNDGIVLDGFTNDHYSTHTILDTNLVNSNPVYYYKGSNGMSIDGIPAGQVILVNCDNIEINNLEIFNTDSGISVYYSSYIKTSRIVTYRTIMQMALISMEQPSVILKITIYIRMTRRVSSFILQLTMLS
jgi:parallel beta-helix repeat protein